MRRTIDAIYCEESLNFGDQRKCVVGGRGGDGDHGDRDDGRVDDAV